MEAGLRDCDSDHSAALMGESWPAEASRISLSMDWAICSVSSSMSPVNPAIWYMRSFMSHGSVTMGAIAAPSSSGAVASMTSRMSARGRSKESGRTRSKVVI